MKLIPSTSWSVLLDGMIKGLSGTGGCEMLKRDWNLALDFDGKGRKHRGKHERVSFNWFKVGWPVLGICSQDILES